MKHIAGARRFCLLSFLFVLCLLKATAQGNNGLWTNYLSYRHADRCEAAGDLVYGIFGGNLLSYDTATGEISLFSKNDGLGGKRIIDMAYCPQLGKLIVLYDDGVVDLIDKDAGQVEHIISLKTAATTVGEPLVLSVDGEYATVCTDQGIAMLDLARKEVRGFYSMTATVKSAAYCDGKIFAVCGGKLIVGRIDDNLYDAGSWVQAYPNAVYYVTAAEGGLYVQTQSAGLLWMDSATYAIERVAEGSYTDWHKSGTRTVFFRTGEAILYNSASPKTVAQNFSFEGLPTDILPVSDSRVYLCLGDEGMSLWKINAEGTLTAEGAPVSGYGAQTDRTGFLQFTTNNRLLASGGSFDYYESVFYTPNAGYLENGNWTFMQTDGVAQAIGTYYRSLTSMVQDPKDPAHHFVATGDYGLFEFKDAKFVKQYNLGNSPLTAFWNNTKDYVRVDALCYDDSGNLWMSNEQVDTILRVMKPDGTWRSVYVDDIKGCRHVEHILFDSKGRLWATQRDWIGNRRGGVLCVELGNLDNPNGHKSTFRYNARNEDGTSVDFSQGVYSMVQDKQGRIWFGAYSGLFVIDDPSTFSASDFLVTQVKVPRNDGTNYADYLLDGIPCTALAVDGADRKWIGTAGYGLYLVNNNGTEILAQFKAEDTPLPSNNILALAVHPETGEVFIGTDEGLVSYQSYVTRPAESLERNNVLVFPNPVRPATGQTVTINGLTDAAEIKIMSAAGFAVATGTSAGGTFRWDCRDTSGRLISAGIYYLLIATADGDEHIAAKIAVVR